MDSRRQKQLYTISIVVAISGGNNANAPQSKMGKLNQILNP